MPSKVDPHNAAQLRARVHWLAHRIALLKAWRAKRNRQLAALKQGAPGVHTALHWALEQVANKVGEVPAGSNRGPLVDKWNTAAGVAPGPGAYWCQSFADAICVAGGGPQIHSGYTVAVVQWAREGKYGLQYVGASYSLAQPGDWVYFKFPGTSRDFCDHVGTRLAGSAPATIEGNTSPGRGGSQNDGGVVSIHGAERIPYTVAVVRPPYKRGA